MVVLATKNKLTTRFNQTASIIKKETPNSWRFERNQFYSYEKTKNNTTKSEWVRIPLDDSVDVRDAFFSVAAAELYRALGPINGAPKTRVEVDDRNIPVAVLSKYDPEFSPVRKDASVNELVNEPQKQHFAECVAMMYLTESFDVNRGNFDINRGVRLDFEYEYIDFALYSSNEALLSAFSRRIITPPYFEIHPLDLHIFPDFLITKPLIVLNVERANANDHKILYQLNNDPGFIKTAHQYFLKALLFDETLIKNILGLHIPESICTQNGALILTFSQYIHNRFQTLKYALVQVPAFRKNVIEHFAEYKDNIKNEFEAYNATFKKPIVDINSLDNKFDELLTLFKNCNLSKESDASEDVTSNFKATFNKDFIKDNTFHQYAMQMLLASNDEAFNINTLCKCARKQAECLSQYLYDSQESPYLKTKYLELLQAFEQCSESENELWEKIEPVFIIEQKITAELKENEVSWYNVNVKIGNIMDEINMVLPKLAAEQCAGINTDLKTNWSAGFLECEQPGFINASEPAYQQMFPQQMLPKIDALLKNCVAYGQNLKNRGDDLFAIAYLKKTEALLTIFRAGIKVKDSPISIAAEMIAELNKADDYLYENKNPFEWLIRAFLNIFSRPEVTLSCGTVSTPWFATERQKKLSKVVEEVYQLPSQPTYAY